MNARMHYPRYREPVQAKESVWDYPRPPRVEAVPERVRVVFNGVTVANSTEAMRVLETASPPTIYIPPVDVLTQFLEPSERRSWCEWKGRARYWHLHVGGRTSPDAVWSYPDINDAYLAIRGYFSFYPGRVDACFIGDEQVRPQPGGFYGGWVTDRIVGPFKGEPGTEGW